jgi:hypothetical protein
MRHGSYWTACERLGKDVRDSINIGDEGNGAAIRGPNQRQGGGRPGQLEGLLRLPARQGNDGQTWTLIRGRIRNTSDSESIGRHRG